MPGPCLALVDKKAGDLVTDQAIIDKAQSALRELGDPTVLCPASVAALNKNQGTIVAVRCQFWT